MELSNVYLMKEEEVHALHHELATNFFDDDLYCAVFPDEKTRMNILKYMFKHYVHAIAPYCHFVADSENLDSVMVVYDTTKEIAWKYHMRLAWLNMKMIPMVLNLRSWSRIKHVIDCWDMFTSRWVSQFVTKDYYHVDMLFTKSEHRGKGYAQKLLVALCAQGQKDGIDITIETHHKENLTLYEKMGFVLMSKISHDQHNLKQYCLLIRNSEEN